MKKDKADTMLGVRMNYGLFKAVEYAAERERCSLSDFVRQSIFKNLQSNGIRIRNMTKPERQTALENYRDDVKITLSEAAHIIGMTSEGLRRLLMRSGLGQQDDNGRWFVLGAELREIKHSREIVFRNTA